MLTVTVNCHSAVCLMLYRGSAPRIRITKAVDPSCFLTQQKQLKLMNLSHFKNLY